MIQRVARYVSLLYIFRYFYCFSDMTILIVILIIVMPQITFSILAIEREKMNHHNVNQIILKTNDLFKMKTINDTYD